MITLRLVNISRIALASGFLTAIALLFVTCRKKERVAQPIPEDIMQSLDKRPPRSNSQLVDRPIETGTMERTARKVPLGLIKHLEVDSLNEKSGALATKVADWFDLTHDEYRQTNSVIADFLQGFLTLEAEHGELIVNDRETYFVLHNCEEAALPHFEALQNEMQTILGPSRGAAISILIAKDLRNGGADKIEVGYVVINNFSKGAVTVSGGKYGSAQFRGHMDDFARWRVIYRALLK